MVTRGHFKLVEPAVVLPAFYSPLLLLPRFSLRQVFMGAMEVVYVQVISDFALSLKQLTFLKSNKFMNITKFADAIEVVQREINLCVCVIVFFAILLILSV